MPRFQRNQLQPYTPGARAARATFLDVTPIGIVVNPRTKEPLLAVTDGTNVGIRSLRASSLGFRHGSGYYDTSGHGKSAEAEKLTGLPRSHTPNGVTPRRGGYGTSLYTALALGAYLVDNGEVEIEMDVEGEGISSEGEGRSDAASQWWDAALNRGLTEREVDSSEETEEDVELHLDTDDLEGCVSLDEGQSLAYVNTVSVDITTSSELNVDTYRYYVKTSRSDAPGAWNNDLVLVELSLVAAGEKVIPADLPRGSELRWLVELAQKDSDLWHDTNATALLAADVRGLDEEAMKLMSLAFQAADLKDRDIDALWYRWRNDLDPSREIAQQHLFTRNSAAALQDVIAARDAVPWDYLAALP